jgi:dTDP-4-dehydrorhamnose 3,5-epimerase
MRFIDTRINGAYVVQPEPVGDDRGFFARLWCTSEFGQRGLTAAFVQCNNSFSADPRTLRGLHYQVAPYGEVKLVRCTRGSIFDAIVDLRPDSPTFREWFGVELTAENRTMLYVPEGCAHGYLTLESRTEVMYPVSQPYHPAAERGIRWDDPAFGIEWPGGAPDTLSPKDQRWANFSQ